jgi:hypothetical protein
MRNIRFSILFALMTLGLSASGQQSEVVLQYISTYREMAISEMQRTGVPASIKLAQGIHETMAGTSELVKKSNNHFGIKCKSSWTGESVSHDDDLRGECFRKYEDPADSYKDHSDFLKGGSRYAFLFELDPLDYEKWAYGLKRAGYATNPKYPLIIIKLIENYHLQDFTLVAMGKMEPGEITLASVLSGKTTVRAEATPVTAVVQEMQSESVEEETTYPPGEFKINETRVIYARKGTPFLAIAQQHHIALARIFEFNDLAEAESLDRSQLIYLQRKRRTGQNEFHKVKAGESLHDIAREEAIRLDALLEYNFLNPLSRPAVGEQLYLHKKAPYGPRLEARVASSNRGEVE